jgi:hypothetical protein
MIAMCVNCFCGSHENCPGPKVCTCTCKGRGSLFVQVVLSDYGGADDRSPWCPKCGHYKCCGVLTSNQTPGEPGTLSTEELRTHVVAMMDAAIAKERERCLKICARVADEEFGSLRCWNALAECERRIRSPGEP